jgi:hypothetical protein
MSMKKIRLTTIKEDGDEERSLDDGKRRIKGKCL